MAKSIFFILFLFKILFFEFGLEVTDQGILGLGGMDPFKPLHLSRRGCKIVIDLDTIPLMEGEQVYFVLFEDVFKAQILMIEGKCIHMITNGWIKGKGIVQDRGFRRQIGDMSF